MGCPANPGTVACGRVDNQGDGSLTFERRLSGAEYNEVYWERGSLVAIVNGEPRASLITNPANGRRPARTPEAERLIQESEDSRSQFDRYDHPELRPFAERCLLFGGPGPPILPVGGLQQQLQNRTDGRSRDDHVGDDPRHADYPDW